MAANAARLQATLDKIRAAGVPIINSETLLVARAPTNLNTNVLGRGGSGEAQLARLYSAEEGGVLDVVIKSEQRRGQGGANRGLGGTVTIGAEGYGLGTERQKLANECLAFFQCQRGGAHPNLIKCYGLLRGRNGIPVGLVLELAEGGDVEGFMKSLNPDLGRGLPGGPPDMARIFSISIGAAAGLA